MFNLAPFEGIRFFPETFYNGWNSLSSIGQFKADLIDEGDSYLLKADLPGFNKDDISIDVKDNLLTIEASISEDSSDENRDYVWRERKCSSFSRSFDISNIIADNIDASYKNGVLEINLPKNESDRPIKKKIEIN